MFHPQLILSKMLNLPFQNEGSRCSLSVLVMQVTQRFGVVSMHLGDFNMSDCNSVETPLAAGLSLVPKESHCRIKMLTVSTMVGKLLFVANPVRTDLAYSASIKIYQNSYANHYFRYIKCRLGLGIVFKKSTSFSLVGYFRIGRR